MKTLEKPLDIRRFCGSFAGVKRCSKCGQTKPERQTSTSTAIMDIRPGAKPAGKLYDARYHQRNRSVAIGAEAEMAG